MKKDESIFWNRLADMPPVEAEQELVLRREGNCLQLAMLQQERDVISERDGPKNAEAKAIGAEMAQIMAQNTLITERVKYLRKLQDRLRWKNAVQAIYGDEGVEQCVIWIQQQYCAEAA